MQAIPLWVGLVVMAGAPSLAMAQVIEGLPRPGRFSTSRAADPNGTSQTLTLTVNFTGGYDDNLSPEGSPATPEQNNVVGTAAAALLYRRGTVQRNLEGYARGYANRGQMTDGQPGGGTTGIKVMTPLGRRNGVEFGFGAWYGPSSLLDVFNNLSDQISDGTVPAVSPTQAITAQRRLLLDATTGFHRNWTSRQRMEFQYSATRRQNIAANGASISGLQQSASLLHNWDFRRFAGLQISYRFDEHRQDRLHGARPLRLHSGDVRMRLNRRFSPSRRLAFMFGGGANQAEAVSILGSTPRVFVEPTAFGSARVDLPHQWSLLADVRRDIAVLDGTVPQPFASTAVSIRLEGVIAPVQLALSWAGSRGDADSNAAAAFDTSTGALQAQYAMARSIALFATFTRYQHHLQDLAPLLTGLPSRYNRNSLRLGLILWVPVLGSS